MADNNIKLIQHNCARSQNVMTSLLEYAVQNRIDIVMIQEPYYDVQRQLTISHPSYQSILSRIPGIRSRVVTYVARFKPELQCTYREDLIKDADMQIMNISNNSVKELYLINVYNEKEQRQLNQSSQNQQLNQLTEYQQLNQFNTTDQLSQLSLNSTDQSNQFNQLSLDKGDYISQFDQNSQLSQLNQLGQSDQLINSNSDANQLNQTNQIIETNQFNSINQYTIDRLLAKLNLQSKSIIIGGDMNSHHNWWNSRIQHAQRAENLIKWVHLHKCELLNQVDQVTFCRKHQNAFSESIIDLTFTNCQNVMNWSIDQNAATGSDHEVIRFDIIVAENQAINSLSTAIKYNIKKADWKKFDQYLQTQSIETEHKMHQLLQNHQFDQAVQILQDLIQAACDLNISKLKITAQSKAWWSAELNQKRRIMTQSRRLHQNTKSLLYDESISQQSIDYLQSQENQQWKAFKRTRNEYFHAIRQAKSDSWMNFLKNARDKDVYKAYKFTKSIQVEKIPTIQFNDQLNITFDQKCNAFLHAMYPKQTYMSQLDSTYQSENNIWSDLTESELQQSIMSSNPNKAPGPTGINFMIVQRAYNSISKLFYMLFMNLIKYGHHPSQWRKGLGAILKKPNKPDYSNPKAYRIITLLECLGKISEKIVANRLAYYASLVDLDIQQSMKLNSNLLDFDQMGGRKFRSAVDAVMNLTHDIQHAFNEKKVTSCLLLDVKGAFDHVSKDQLLQNLHKLNLPIMLINWVSDFMTQRQISLMFDGNQQEMTEIECGIPQGSPISPILFLIYIRNLFTTIKAKHSNIQMPSFIDDVAVYVNNKTAEQNCNQLSQITQEIFIWADQNNMQFDDAKSELIHFEKVKKHSRNSIILPNHTELKPQTHVKWLGIWLDKKLNFKKHIETRMQKATNALHAISTLMRLEWGISAAAARQLYLTCILSIAEYGSEIWFESQKNHSDLYQKLQNKALRKILGVFKTSPVQLMEIEADIMPAKIRLMQKNQKYALRIMQLGQQNPISQRLPENFTENHQQIERLSDTDKYETWFHEVQSKSTQSTQLTRILHSISKWIQPNIQIDEFVQINQAQQSLNVKIHENDQLAKTEYWQILAKLQKMQNQIMLCTDGSQCKQSVAAAVNLTPFMRNSRDFQSIVQDFKSLKQESMQIEKKSINFMWKLNQENSIMQAELFAIYQALKIINHLMKVNDEIDYHQIYVFSDSQQALKAIQDNTVQGLSLQIYELCKEMQKEDVQIKFQWIPSHQDAIGNQLADKYAKKSHELTKIQHLPISAEFIRKQIKEQSINWWKSQIKDNRLDLSPKESHIKFLSSKTHKMIFSTIMQLKLNHGYFKTYLHRLNHADSNLCSCKRKQTPQHLVTECSNYLHEQRIMKKELNMSTLNFKYLMKTQKGLISLINYIQTTLIATRRWHLHLIDADAWQHQGGWGDIEEIEENEEENDEGYSSFESID